MTPHLLPMTDASPWLSADSLDGFPGLSAHDRLEIRRQGGALLPLRFPGDGRILRGAARPAPRPAGEMDLSEPALEAPWLPDHAASEADAWTWIRMALCERVGLWRRWRLLFGRPAPALPPTLPVLMLASPEDVASVAEDRLSPGGATDATARPWAAHPLSPADAWSYCVAPERAEEAEDPADLLARPHEAVLVPTLQSARRLRRALRGRRAPRLLALDWALVRIGAEEPHGWDTLGALGRESSLRLAHSRACASETAEAMAWMANALSFVLGVEEQRLLFSE